MITTSNSYANREYAKLRRAGHSITWIQENKPQLFRNF